jgi:hypothetical protein
LSPSQFRAQHHGIRARLAPLTPSLRNRCGSSEKPGMKQVSQRSRFGDEGLRDALRDGFAWQLATLNNS